MWCDKNVIDKKSLLDFKISKLQFTMSTNKAFAVFNDEVNKLSSLFNNFEKLWIDYEDIFKVCQINFLQFYIVNMFEGLFYVLEQIPKIDCDTLLSQTNDAYVKKDIEASKSKLNNMVLLLKGKYQALYNILYNRNVDISRTKCVINSEVIQIVLSRKHEARTLMNTAS